MKVARILARRQQSWYELESQCREMEQGKRRRLGPLFITRFASRYRAACADLALATTYQLPPNTVHYLHHLVGRAHNQLYRSRSLGPSVLAREILIDVPQRLFHDNALRLAFVLFWGGFLGSMFLAYVSPHYTQQLVGEDELTKTEEMHAKSVGQGAPPFGGAMAGIYISHNTGIGLRCFAYGLLLGVGGLFVTLSNAIFLGAIFGYMATSPHRDNFFQFVTAHGPFELTAIVVASAAGMKLGFSLVDTKGRTRGASLRAAARDAMPTVAAAIVLFALAALIEAFLSPSSAPYWIKCAVAVVSSGLLLCYFVLLGYPRSPSDAV